MCHLSQECAGTDHGRLFLTDHTRRIPFDVLATILETSFTMSMQQICGRRESSLIAHSALVGYQHPGLFSRCFTIMPRYGLRFSLELGSPRCFKLSYTVQLLYGQMFVLVLPSLETPIMPTCARPRFISLERVSNIYFS